MKKRGKSDFWNRREAFARAIERDTKEKSEEVAQRLAQAVRADEEKQAKRQAARAGAGAQKAEPQAPRADGWGRARAQGSPPRTRAGAGNEAQGGAPRAKLSAWGEIAGGVHPRTGAQGGAPYAGPGEWEETPRLHTMELPWPGTGLTGTQPGGMMEEISRRVAAAVQPGSLQLQPSPIGPLQKPENLPGFIDETAVPGEGLVPYGVNGAESAVQLLRAAPQKLQAEQGKSNALLTGQLSQMQPTDEYIPPDYTDPQWWMDWVDSTHEGHKSWQFVDSNPSYWLFKFLVPALSQNVKTVELDLTMHNPEEGIKAYNASNIAQLGKKCCLQETPILM